MSNKRSLMILIVLIATLAQVATDIYTPSMPAIAAALKTTLGQVQWTMTAFLIGLSIAALFYGPLSEHIGRRKALIQGTVLSLIGTGLCVFASHITMLQVGRFIQGCGLGASASLWRAIFRDHYSGKEMARLISYFLGFIIFSVMAAPFVGGYLQMYLGWRSNFIFVFIWTVIILALLLFYLDESRANHVDTAFSVKGLFTGYFSLFKNRGFLVFTFISFVTYGAVSAWLTAGPIILIHNLAVTPVGFGHLMLLAGLSFGLAGLLNLKLVKVMQIRSIVLLGIVITFFSGALLWLATYFFGDSVLIIMISVFFLMIGTTLTFPNSFTTAFENVGAVAGFAGSLYSAFQLLGGVLFSALVSHIAVKTSLPMAVMFMASGAIAVVLYCLRPTSRTK